MGDTMDFHDISTRGLVLLGCGKMGSALLAGWLKRGFGGSGGLGHRSEPVGMGAGAGRCG